MQLLWRWQMPNAVKPGFGGMNFQPCPCKNKKAAMGSPGRPYVEFVADLPVRP
jgi:hypothetical protein